MINDAHIGLNLTPRLREVLTMIADGICLKQIGERLGVSVKTAEYHYAILRKQTGLSGVASLTKLAIRLGLTTV